MAQDSVAPLPALAPHSAAAPPNRVLLMAGSMEGGGSEHQTLLLLRHLDRRLFAPELYLTYRRGDLLDQVPSDVPIHAFDDDPPPVVYNWPGRIHRQIVNHLRQRIADSQIDVVYDRTFHMTLIAAPACGNHVGRVSTIVSPPDRDLPHSESRFLALKRWRLARGYRQSHAVIAVSDAVRRSAIRYYGLPPDRVQTLHSPVDLLRLRSAAAADPGIVLEPDAVHLACIGRMTREKGQDLLIEALSQIRATTPPVVLWLIGDGPQRDQLQRRAAELQLTDRVRFTGHLPSPANLLARCDGLVCPSRYEGLPNVVLEAFGLGVPVIATDVGGVSELVIDGRTGYLVRPDDATALAQKIERWLTSARPHRYATVAEATRLVEHTYGIERYIAGVQRHLTSAAQRERAAST